MKFRRPQNDRLFKIDRSSGDAWLQDARSRTDSEVVESAALYKRFISPGNADFADRVLSAMRHEFGRCREGRLADENDEPQILMPFVFFFRTAEDLQFMEW